MKITPVKGMDDYLPIETNLRDFLQSKILETYKSQGFNRIYTPIVEDIENLEKSDGGENLNLIFKILKRGDKFISAVNSNQFNSLSDLGLRYDLTLPLSRFYVCHKAEITLPFKVIQIDRVYRAERPQKGRNREFIQCDIDILGSNSINSEIELIDTTARALMNVGIEKFKIRINDRQILKKILLSFGFGEEDLDGVCIVFDKLDKIGSSLIKQELLDKGYNELSVNKLYDLIKVLPITLENVEQILGDCEQIQNLLQIISSIKILSKGKYDIVFDLSLVRGQGYYTGTIFEIESSEYSCSIGGGGRYDNLIGKFTGENVPAVGFSIGFERIFSILKEKNQKLQNQNKKIAVIYKDDFLDCYQFGLDLQKDYTVSLFEMPKKFGKLLSKLEQDNFDGYVVPCENHQIKFFY